MNGARKGRHKAEGLQELVEELHFLAGMVKGNELTLLDRSID
jgi:hypothetical protein